MATTSVFYNLRHYSYQQRKRATAYETKQILKEKRFNYNSQKNIEKATMRSCL
jgi:hypothetical protein